MKLQNACKTCYWSCYCLERSRGVACTQYKNAALGRQSLSGKQKYTIFNLTQDKECVKNG